MSEFTHFNTSGEAIMVDVSAKDDTIRVATASGVITMSRDCFHKVKNGEMAKGDVLSVARIAGIMGTKRTPDLIPLCHTLLLSKAEIDFELLDSSNTIKCNCTVKTTGKTGVEMEALTGAFVALLTIYDMCKAIDKSMEISQVHLDTKSGGKSGLYMRESNND